MSFAPDYSVLSLQLLPKKFLQTLICVRKRLCQKPVYIQPESWNNRGSEDVIGFERHQLVPAVDEPMKLDPHLKRVDNPVFGDASFFIKGLLLTIITGPAVAGDDLNSDIGPSLHLSFA